MTTTTNTPQSPHPIIWIAGIAVTLFSLVGIASLAGWLPKHDEKPMDPPAAVSQSAAEPATSPAAAAAPAASATPATPVAAAPAAPAEKPAPVHHAAKHKSRTEQVATLPPPGAGVPPDYAPPAQPAASVCKDCGVIANIRQVTHEGQGTGLGAVGGGVVGGLIGNNIGQGNGRTLATIAGMVGGGLLGNKIEKNQRQTVSYQVSVRMEDGTSSLVNYENSPPWRVGDAVKVVNGTLVAR